MGALNVSPESFYGGSVHRDSSALLEAGLAMVAEGAAFVDVGARSTAPYLPTQISEEEESERLGAAVAALAGKLSVPVSADTTRARVARVALDAGARIVNDVSGLRDPEMGRLARERGASVVLMASPDGTSLGQPLASVLRLLTGALERARAAGVPEAQVVLDPGIGFFRQAPVPWDEWDIAVLGGLGALARLGRPLAVGLSRKSFLGAVTGRAEPAERLAGSLAATAVAVLNGAALIRTHDVAETLDAVRVAERLRRAAPG
ncbi:MAG TPA: dihydropteroate synthase [Methylomirabilota bacterium]|jgi:dihydropteroate synthase